MSNDPTPDLAGPAGNPAFAGIAALLLDQGCPPDRLDEAFANMANWPLPGSLQEAVEHCINAIAELPDDDASQSGT